jgi:ribosomal protein S18 acetylase RimI-like enzyme
MREESHLVVATTVRPANRADVPALTKLINECYAVESFFVDGERTHDREITGLLDGGHFLVLDRGGGGLAGAVYVKTTGERGYFGMLSVASDVRGLGIGRRLVAIAEAYCAAQGCTAMDLQIVNLREELGPWYRSQGYQESGTAPYDHRDLKRPAHFVKMSKALSSAG